MEHDAVPVLDILEDEQYDYLFALPSLQLDSKSVETMHSLISAPLSRNTTNMMPCLDAMANWGLM